MSKKKIVMALSGGLDSSALLGYLLEKGHDVSTVSFYYGSKHNEHELRAAQAVAMHYGVLNKQIDISAAMALFESDLLLSGGAIPEGHYEDATMSRTVVPSRNIIFISILAGYAWTIGADAVAVGIHTGDHAIYADCRKEFLKAVDSAIFLGTDRRVEVVAPFIDYSKKDIVLEGLEFQVPFELTRTCYTNHPVACGKCGSCVERQEAFALNFETDPIAYQKG